MMNRHPQHVPRQRARLLSSAPISSPGIEATAQLANSLTGDGKALHELDVGLHVRGVASSYDGSVYFVMGQDEAQSQEDRVLGCAGDWPLLIHLLRSPEILRRVA